MSFDAIPAELRERPQWVVWRYEERDGKPTKAPYQAAHPRKRASSTDPSTWASFDEASAQLAHADGLGYVFSADDPYFGLDLDEGLSEADKGAIMLSLDTYAERSVSGAGYHCIARGCLNGDGRHPPGLGVFDRARFFVMTGEHVAGTPATIEERQAQLDEILARYLPKREPVEQARPPAPVDLDDVELLEKARAAKNGAAFERLWAGDTSGHPSHSEADLALCSSLAFWTGRDPERIDRMFRSSGLYREKWDRADYREQTIEAAVAGCAEVYTPARPFQGREPGAEDEPPGEAEKASTAAGELPPIESWSAFRRRAAEPRRFLIRGLWEEGALGFMGAPPKAGKTWGGLDLSVAVATGTTALGRFEVPKARPVLYVALEGSRAALEARVGCLCHGRNLDPDTVLEGRLFFWYKPRGLNLADPSFVEELRRRAAEVGAALVVIDVLRRAASFQENSAQEVGALLRSLARLEEDARAVLLLHHYGKLTEVSRDRAPGERLSGSSAMWGALDVGIYITASEDGARRLRLEFDVRDYAAPELLGLRLEGEGSGENGSLTYNDSACFVEDEAPARREDKAPAEAIAEWIREQGGRATAGEIREEFDIVDGTLRERRGRLAALGIEYVSAGGGSHYRVSDESLFDPAGPAPADPATIAGQPYCGAQTA